MRALTIAATGMSAQEQNLEVIAHNVANINTTGYKADGAVFEEFLSPTASHGDFLGGDRRLSYVQDRATWIDFSQGPLEQTNNPLDVSVSGNAFLTVTTPRGERYTRNGALQINATGQLVTNEGYPVLGDGGPIQFQINDKQIAISADGNIRVREGADTKSDAQRGRLRLVRFDQVARLQKDGSSLFSAPGGTLPQPVQPPQRVRVMQGALEQSNVRGMVEMARMIEITRSYTQIANLLQAHSDMRRGAIDKLSEVPA